MQRSLARFFSTLRSSHFSSPYTSSSLTRHVPVTVPLLTSTAIHPNSQSHHTPVRFMATSFNNSSSSSSISSKQAHTAAATTTFPTANFDPNAMTPMACFQCAQTQDTKGCSEIGVCGKTPETAAAQDTLVYLLTRLAADTSAQQTSPETKAQVANFIQDALFATLTNVNFDESRFWDSKKLNGDTLIAKAHQLREKVRKENGLGQINDYTPGNIDPSAANLIGEAHSLTGIYPKVRNLDPSGAQNDIFSARELLIYGIKGMAAYSSHAQEYGKSSTAIHDYLVKALAYLAKDTKDQDLNELVGLALECGKVNLETMGLLNQGATERYGHPEPTRVLTTPVAGKCILVSGHDIIDLEKVLEATKDKGINVYTHGELLPAHAYPLLKQKYPHLVGNYGGPWQLQKIEFAAFPGPILVTTNCILEPRKSYRDRVFTAHTVGFPGVKHLASDKDYDLLVQKAQEMKGFTPQDEDKAGKSYTLTGFGHQAVLSIADKVINAVQQGKIKRFFLIGGCDGSESERSYYADLAKAVPKDCVVLTLACGKYRFNKHFDDWFGEIEGTGIPRMLDIGQCNDSYSAVQIAVALANAFKTDVNGLPLSFVLSWFEQKAVAVLLTLLHLGIQNIRVGPVLPAFISPNILNVLVQNYKLTPIGDPQEDLKLMLQGK